MTSYAELLQNKNWLSKRKEILNRDKNICQNCHNDHYSNFKKSKIIFIECLSNILFMEGNLGDDRIHQGIYKYSVKFLDEDKNRQDVEFYSKDYKHKTTYLNGYNLFYKKAIDNNDDSKLEILCISNPEDNNEFFSAKTYTFITNITKKDLILGNIQMKH